MLDKQVCRKQSKQFIFDSSTNKHVADQKISSHLNTLINELYPDGFQYCGFYMPLDDEPKLLLPENAVVTFPKVLNDDKIEFYSGKIDSFKKGAFDVYEPQNLMDKHIEIKKHDFFVVPGLSFSSQGYRLGRGKGYYDRFLKVFKKNKIGIGLSLIHI